MCSMLLTGCRLTLAIMQVYLKLLAREDAEARKCFWQHRKTKRAEASPKPSP